ncbi:hypothetical protein FE784_25805 [Paenibacillus hemerocallicola]|uniref:Beta-galactosidase trimerisation domain-containing protein n=1 Tax=Paenibacillus hemerocallicola TaxID=1172614 RepID=A0A5C4T4T7_9BACL|nr:alpha-amylase family protein [Paenibacillus hemerocallicola]TNJ63337.1 hypothetical protein FE784_25805 [Paenibacillus hemerocallicola]
MPGEKRGVAGSAVLLFESDSIWEEKRQPIIIAGDFLLFRNVEFDKVMQLRGDALLKRAATFCTKVQGAFDFYDLLCMNSPYRDYVYDQLKEIASSYDVDGFFFDITYVWPGACYCDYCKRWYGERFGTEMPVDPQPGTADMRNFLQFRREIRHHFLRDAVMVLKALNPNYAISWNGSGNYHLANREADEHADYTTTEFHPPHYLDGSIKARWQRRNGKPFELSLPHEMGSWGDWTLLPEPTLLTMAAVAVSNGAALRPGHIVIPSGEFAGTINPDMIASIGAMNRWIEEREPWLHDARSVPHAAVLERRISEYALVVLPDQAYLPERLQLRIRDYVAQGGRLLATGHTSLYGRDGVRLANFGLADVIGNDFLDISPYSVHYLSAFQRNIAEGVPRMPILLKKTSSPLLRVRKRGGVEALAMLVRPAVETRAHRHVYHQHAHPERVTDYPAITYHRHGSGAAIYFSGSVETSFVATGSPWLRKIVLNCIDRLLPEPVIRIEAPLSVEVTLMKQQEQHRWIIHFTSIRTERTDGTPAFIEEIIPTPTIRVTVRARPSKIYTAPDMTDIVFEEAAQGVRFDVHNVGFHAMVVLEGMPACSVTP